MSTFIICYVPPFFSRSLTKIKNVTVSYGHFTNSSTKYRVFASPNSYIYLSVGGEDGFNGSSPVNKPIITLWLIIELSLVIALIKLTPDPPKLRS